MEQHSLRLLDQGAEPALLVDSHLKLASPVQIRLDSLSLDTLSESESLLEGRVFFSAKD